ncbi:MAG: hypothetical protein JSW58_08225 [Candidatus Latescibacterota bacterium]|nr:MAG: hypothetical protein JSW58_08225 [Candidatus Latescibacterota bacterium]
MTFLPRKISSVRPPWPNNEIDAGEVNFVEAHEIRDHQCRFNDNPLWLERIRIFDIPSALPQRSHILKRPMIDKRFNSRPASLNPRPNLAPSSEIPKKPPRIRKRLWVNKKLYRGVERKDIAPRQSSKVDRIKRRSASDDPTYLPLELSLIDRQGIPDLTAHQPLLLLSSFSSFFHSAGHSAISFRALTDVQSNSFQPQVGLS